MTIGNTHNLTTEERAGYRLQHSLTFRLQTSTSIFSVCSTSMFEGQGATNGCA